MAGPCGEKRGPDLHSRNRQAMECLEWSEPRYVSRVRKSRPILLRVLGRSFAETSSLEGPSLRRGRGTLQPRSFLFPTALSISGQPRSGHPRPRTRHPPLPLYHRSIGTISYFVPLRAILPVSNDRDTLSPLVLLARIPPNFLPFHSRVPCRDTYTF